MPCLGCSQFLWPLPNRVSPVLPRESELPNQVPLPLLPVRTCLGLDGVGKQKCKREMHETAYMKVTKYVW